MSLLKSIWVPFAILGIAIGLGVIKDRDCEYRGGTVVVESVRTAKGDMHHTVCHFPVNK